MPFSRENRHLTLSLALVIAGLFIVGIGAQAYVAARDNAERDRQDREYAECLTQFAADLSAAAEARSLAAGDLNAARDHKDRLLDRLLVIIAQAEAHRDDDRDAELPPALLARYERVLEARVEAQERFHAVEREYQRTISRNPYKNPKVECDR